MDLVGIAENPLPPATRGGMFQARDGLGLRYGLWPASGHRAQGTVCIFQGRAEFIEKYFETVGDLRRRGFHVAAMDWRGQGGSERQTKYADRGHVAHFSDYIADLARFMETIVLPNCPPPYFGLGHSMGGLILMLACRRRPVWFERIVLSAPMLEITLSQTPRSVMRATSGLARAAGLGGQPVSLFPRKARQEPPFEGNLLSSDPVRFARMGQVLAVAPALRIEQPTFAWLNAACAAMAELEAEGFPGTLRAPLLMVAAGNDRVVSTPAIERFARRLPAGAAVVVPGARHELMMEADRYREQFWAAFDAFVPGSANLYAEGLAGLG